MLANQSSQAYTTFADCYDDLLDKVQNGSIVLPPGEKVEDIGDSVVDFMNDMEDNFACNGVCEPGLFWFHKDVTSPPPTSNCQDGIKDIFEEYANGIGAALMISFIVTAFAFGVQYFLWRKKKQHSHEHHKTSHSKH